MASPQVENGFVKIANELYDQLVKQIYKKNHFKVALCVLRKTYGFGKKFDWISYSQMENYTGLDRGNCQRATMQLLEQKLLSKQQHHNGYLLGINKDYSQWEVLSKQQLLSKQQTQKKPPIKGFRKKPRTSTPAEFLITPELLAWIREKFGEVPKETIATERDKFLDHHRKLDSRWVYWDSAWRNWMRNWWDWTGKEQLKPGTHGFEDLNAGKKYHNEE